MQAIYYVAIITILLALLHLFRTLRGLSGRSSTATRLLFRAALMCTVVLPFALGLLAGQLNHPLYGPLVSHISMLITAGGVFLLSLAIRDAVMEIGANHSEQP